MRFDRLCLKSAIISAILLSLFCSRSDVITGAGGSVVEGIDPSLTDIKGGFVTVSLIDTAVGAAFSLPLSPDPLFGTRVEDHILIGVSEEGDTLAAHVQYRMAGDTSYAAEDSLIGAYIRFKAADGDNASPDGSITLFPSGALHGFTPVNRADKTPPVNAGDSGTDNRVGSLSFDEGAVGSLPFPGHLADSVFRARASGDTGLFKTFAFSILDYAGPLLKLDNPYIVVERLRKDCCSDSTWMLSDTIRSDTTRYTAFEDAKAAAARALEPYSSQLTHRTAVFRVNVGRILDSLSRAGLSGDSSELLNAVITVRYHEPKPEEAAAEANDSSAVKLSSINAGNYKALILDTLLTNDIDTLFDSAPHLLRYRFAQVSESTKLTAPYNTHSFKAPLRNAIDKQAPYVYVYLRPTTERSAIWWCKPTITYPPNVPSVTVETVFTPSRAR